MKNSYVIGSVENLFKGVSQRILLSKSDILFEQGDEIDYIYFLSNGELNIIKNNQMMWQAHQNEFIGITSFFSGEFCYSYTVKACKESEVIKIPIAEFKSELLSNSSLNDFLMKLFCNRIALTLDKADVITRLTRKKRLIKLLIEKAKLISKSNRVVLRYSISDIADFVNVSNNFTKELLMELQSKNLIKIFENKIEITDYKGLVLVSKMKGIKS